MTIFKKIIDGQIPCHRIYEDEHVLAFLDIGPLSRGHALIVPKEAKAHLHELSDDSSAAIGRVLPRICRAIMKTTGATAYNVLQNNGADAHQLVPHVHFHVIPKPGSKDTDGGLVLRWKGGKLESAEGAALAADIRAAL